MRTGGIVLVWAGVLALAAGCRRAQGSRGVTPQKMADALHAVIAADRAVYTREVVSRLQDQENVLRASEHFRDDRALPLPAQMLRMGAEAAEKSRAGFSYALLSPWPINRQNAPRTDAEKTGMKSVIETGKTYYGEESLGGARYLTAIYPDKAISDACAACHDAHKDSPRHDFKAGDIMGGLVIRIPVE
jgi:hypothetical protein